MQMYHWVHALVFLAENVQQLIVFICFEFIAIYSLWRFVIILKKVWTNKVSSLKNLTNSFHVLYFVWINLQNNLTQITRWQINVAPNRSLYRVIWLFSKVLLEWIPKWWKSVALYQYNFFNDTYFVRVSGTVIINSV